MRRLSLCAGIVLAMLAAVGCEDELPRASEITKMRVLGARTEVEGEPQRSTPRPGETAHVTWTVAFPDPAQDDSEIASMLVTCTAPTRFSGVPVCQELLDAAGGGGLLELLAGAGSLKSLKDCEQEPDQRIEVGPFALTCVTGTPHSDVEIEPSFKARAKLVQGVICRNGTPRFDADDPTGVSCKPRSGVKASKVESLAVYGTIPVQYKADDENFNPSIDAAQFTFGEAAIEWPALAEDEDLAELIDDCGPAAIDGRVLSTNGKEEELEIEYDASAREEHDGEPEALEFSTYVTLGKLSRRFTVFNTDDTPPFRSKLEWDVPKDVRDKLGERNRLVRFYFTLLDHRGGYAVTTREICVGRDIAHTN